jgi:hypothetical protein
MAKMNSNLLVAAFNAVVGVGLGVHADFLAIQPQDNKLFIATLAVFSGLNLASAAINGTRGWRANSRLPSPPPGIS